MFAKIFVKGLELDTIIGDYENERHTKQKLIFHIGLYTNIDISQVNEDLSKTIDYALLTQKITDFVENSSYRLIETLTFELGCLLLEDEKVQGFELEIEKPQALSRAQPSLKINYMKP